MRRGEQRGAALRQPGPLGARQHAIVDRCDDRMTRHDAMIAKMGGGGLARRRAT
jgi:hypothetical protein